MIQGEFPISKVEVTNLQIRADSISFERLQGSGPRTQTKDIAFDREVTQATVVLTGTDFGFSPSDDHHLGNINIKADLATIEGNIVRVTATLGVRDWSDNWDDDYEGTVHFAVIAETLAP
jgi:hypothetical protein